VLLGFLADVEVAARAVIARVTFAKMAESLAIQLKSRGSMLN